VFDAAVLGPPGHGLQVILLDDRWSRSRLHPGRAATWVLGPYLPDARPGATLLGEEQWRWLEEQLREPARLRLLVCGIQVLSEHHGWEAWANFPREQERLFELLRRTRAEGLVILSGDRHFAEISRRQEPGLYPLYDITSSGLNQHFPESYVNPNRYRVEGASLGGAPPGAGYPGAYPGAYLLENFGELDVDWSDPDPALRVRIFDVAGPARLALDIRLSELRFR
jgi:alkaline phosphatase D